MRAALLLNALAGGWGKISMLLFRVVQVPILLGYLGVNEFGRWLILASIPSWLALANLGFGSVAGNEMSMAMGAGDLRRARVSFSTALSLVIGIAAIGGTCAAVLVQYVPWNRILKVGETRNVEFSYAAVWLTLSVFVSFFGEVFDGRFRAARKAHVSMVLSSFRPWVELAAMAIALHSSTRFDHLAFASFASTVIFVLALRWIGLRMIPSLAFSVHAINPAFFRSLFKKGLAFQAFPLGNAMVFQGNLLVVQSLLGPAAVALFATTRTLVRSVNQIMELVNQVTWPEFSHYLGARELVKAARLHRASVAISLVAAFISVVFLGLFGKPLYGLWTHHSIVLSETLLLLFLLPIPFNALWFTSSVVHAASNEHEGLAARYLIASGLSLCGCGGLAYFFGIEGAALSTLVVDIILIPYVLRYSLKLTGDSWKEFFKGVVTEVRTAPATARRLLSSRI